MVWEYDWSWNSTVILLQAVHADMVVLWNSFLLIQKWLRQVQICSKEEKVVDHAIRYAEIGALLLDMGYWKFKKKKIFKRNQLICLRNQVKCTGNSLCSETGVTVVITDQSSGDAQLVLSGTAFRDMASDPGSSSDLLNAGVVSILFQRYLSFTQQWWIEDQINRWIWNMVSSRFFCNASFYWGPLMLYSVPCEYQGMNIAFHVNEGSSAYWFGVLVEYENGDGDLGAVDLMQVNVLRCWSVNYCN